MGDAVSAWASGRMATQEVEERLQESALAAAAVERELAQLQAPPGVSSLLEAARAAASSRTALVQEARAFVRSGQPTRTRLVEFGWRSSERTAGSVVHWLRARQAALSQAPPSPYYAWQRQVLPLQQGQVEVSSLAYEIVYRASPGSSSSLRGPAEEVVRRAGDLRSRLAAVEPPSGLQPAHQAALAEAAALERFCEAVRLLVEDPSPDAASRLRRFTEDLRARSREAEERSLEALEAAQR